EGPLLGVGVEVVDRRRAGDPRVAVGVEGHAVGPLGVAGRRRDLPDLGDHVAAVDPHQRTVLPAEHPNVSLLVGGAAVGAPLAAGPRHAGRVLDLSGLAVDAAEVAGGRVAPADPHARLGAVLRADALPGDRSRSVLIGDRAAAGQRQVPEHALVLAPRTHVVGAGRGVDDPVVVEILAALLDHRDLGDAARTIDHHRVAEQVDRGPRGIGGARTPDVPGLLDAGVGVDLRDRAGRRIGDPDVAERIARHPAAAHAVGAAAARSGGVVVVEVELDPVVVVVVVVLVGGA